MSIFCWQQAEVKTTKIKRVLWNFCGILAVVRLGVVNIALVILQSGLCLLPQCLLATDLAGLELPQVQKPRKNNKAVYGDC